MAFGMLAGMLAAVAVDVRLRTSEIDGDTPAHPLRGPVESNQNWTHTGNADATHKYPTLFCVV